MEMTKTVTIRTVSTVATTTTTTTGHILIGFLVPAVV